MPNARFEPCPICSTPVAIREDGTVSTHLKPVELRTQEDSSYCPGSDTQYLTK